MNTNDEYANYGEAESQCRKILRHMRGGAPITSLQALKLYGCMRLASRICDLRKQLEKEGGRELITVERVTTDTGKNVAMYRIVKNKKRQEAWTTE